MTNNQDTWKNLNLLLENGIDKLGKKLVVTFRISHMPKLPWESFQIHYQTIQLMSNNIFFMFTEQTHLFLQD